MSRDRVEFLRKAIEEVDSDIRNLQELRNHYTHTLDIETRRLRGSSASAGASKGSEDQTGNFNRTQLVREMIASGIFNTSGKIKREFLSRGVEAHKNFPYSLLANMKKRGEIEKQKDDTYKLTKLGEEKLRKAL